MTRLSHECNIATMNIVSDLEAEMRAASLSPTAVFVRAGIAPSTWFRWKKGVSPNIRTVETVKTAIAQMVEERAVAAA